MASENEDESRRSQVVMTLMPWAADVSQWCWTNGRSTETLHEPVKPHRSTDCRLELVYMKKESIVIVHHYGTVIETWVLHLPPVSVGELLGCEDGVVNL